MPRILVFTSDQSLGRELAQQLSRRRHSVTVFAMTSGRTDVNTELLPDVQVVILDMTEDSPMSWKMLDQITQFAACEVPGPRILCVSKIYRGPHIELEIERKGARLVYVR